MTAATSDTQDKKSPSAEASPEELSKMFEAAMKSSNSKLDITDAESTQFTAAMKDPSFCSLLHEYMQDISNPAHREEQEAYLAQMERENKVPTNKQLITPVPSFVVKVKTVDTREKIFINLCSHASKIDPPVGESADGGTQWHLPYSLGPQRSENDRAGTSNVPTFDICFHIETLTRATTSKAFQKMVIDTALTAVASVLKQELDTAYHILKGIAYKSGPPITLCITVKPPKKTSSSNNTTSSSSSFNSVAHALASAPSSSSACQKPCSSSSPDAPPVVVTAPLSLPLPSYQLIQRGKFDMAAYTQSSHSVTTASRTSRPTQLVVKFSLAHCPRPLSATSMVLDVSCQMVSVQLPGHAPLDVLLPYCVDDSPTSTSRAALDPKKGLLIVTLVVLPPPRVECESDESMAGPESTSMPERSPVTENKTRDDTFTSATSSLLAANDLHEDSDSGASNNHHPCPVHKDKGQERVQRKGSMQGTASPSTSVRQPMTDPLNYVLETATMMGYDRWYERPVVSIVDKEIVRTREDAAITLVDETQPSSLSLPCEEPSSIETEMAVVTQVGATSHSSPLRRDELPQTLTESPRASLTLPEAVTSEPMEVMPPPPVMTFSNTIMYELD